MNGSATDSEGEDGIEIIGPHDRADADVCH